MEQLQQRRTNSSALARLKRVTPPSRQERALQVFLLWQQKAGKISKGVYERIQPVGASRPRMYGIPKIHKNGTPLRPILSMVNAPQHELAKWLAEVLKPVVEKYGQHTSRPIFFSISNSFNFLVLIWVLFLSTRCPFLVCAPYYHLGHCVVATVAVQVLALAAGLSCFTAGCHMSKLSLSPQPPLKQRPGCAAQRWEKAQDRLLFTIQRCPWTSTYKFFAFRYRLPACRRSSWRRFACMIVEPRLSTASRRRTKVKRHWKIAQSCRSPTVSAPSPLSRFQQRCLCTSRRGACERISAIQAVLKGRTVAIRTGKIHQFGLFFLLEACQRNATWWSTAGWPANAKLQLLHRHSSISRRWSHRSSAKALVSTRLHESVFVRDKQIERMMNMRQRRRTEDK